MWGVNGSSVTLSSLNVPTSRRSLNEVKNSQHVEKAEVTSAVKKLWIEKESPPSDRRTESVRNSIDIPTQSSTSKLYKRARSTGNFLTAPKLLQRVTSFSELHEMTRSSNALNRLKHRHRNQPVTKEEFDTRTKGLEKELKQLRCEILVLRRSWREKTKENSRTFMRMTKYLAWVTGVHLLILRVLSFVRLKYRQDIIKDLSTSLVLRLIRSSEGRKQLQLYLHHVIKHQISVLTMKISPDLISLFCLSRPSEMFRICGFLVVLFNDPIRLYQQIYWPSRDTPRVSSILANLGANILFLTTRWWIVAHGLPKAIGASDYARQRTGESPARSVYGGMMPSVMGSVCLSQFSGQED